MKPRTAEHCAHIRAAHIGMRIPRETRTCSYEKCINTFIVRPKNPKKFCSRRCANSGRVRTKEQNKANSNRGRKMWQSPLYREKQLKAIFKGLDFKPNKSELLLNNLLQELFPNEWKFVGDGEVIIGYKNPDFINVNGQKKIIEMNGDYWHGFEKTGRTKIEEEQQRRNHFVQYGYKTLIVWEYELDDIKKLKDKILEFHTCC